MDVAAPSARRLFVTADTKAGARKVAVILDGGDDWDAFRRKLADKFGDTTLKYGAFTLEKNGAEVSEAPELMDGDELRVKLKVAKARSGSARRVRKERREKSPTKVRVKKKRKSKSPKRGRKKKVAVEEPEILVVESEPEEEIASGPSYLDIFRKAVEKVQAATRFYSDILSGSPDFEIHVSTTPLVPGEDNGESAIVRKLSLPRRRRIAEVDGLDTSLIPWAPAYPRVLKAVSALLANEGIVPGRCWHVGPYAKGDFVGSQVHDGVTDVSDEEAWAEAIRTFPWTLGARLARTSSHLCGQLNVDDKESRVEALHGLWELACSPSNHYLFDRARLRTLVEMLHFTAAEASQLTSRDHEIAEHVVITLWWLLLHDSGMDFRDALLELSLVEQLINRLDIMVDGMKFEPSAVVARQLRTIMGCLGMLLLSPTGVQRLVEPRADRVTTPKAPPSAPAMGGRSTTRTIVAMSMEPDMSLTSAHCWEVLVRAASVLSPIELALPHPEIIGIGLLRRCLLQDVEAARHSFIVGYGVAHLILLMKAPTATVRQSAGALLGSLSENGGWETIAKVGSANELLAAMVEMVETSCTEELTLDEDGSSAARSYSEQVDSARMWAKAGRALCGVSKAVVAQGEKVSEKALRSLIGAAGATYRSHTARHAAAGVVGAMGDLARARKYASALMKFEVAPALVGMLECYDIMTRMQAAAAIGCLAWHGELEHPCGPEMLPGPVPLQGGHRRMLVLVGVLRKLLYCLRDGISVDDAVTKAKMLMGDEIDLSLVMARHTIHTRLLKSATCAALMLLAADEQEHERSDLASFVQAAEMCTDENPAALLFLSAGIWCLTRVPRNRLRLLGASAIAQLVELSWRTWTSLKGDEQLHQLPTDGRLKMTYHPLLHALEWLFGAIWMLASSNGEQVTPEGASDGDTSDGWKKLKNVLHMKAISQKQNTKLKTVTDRGVDLLLDILRYLDGYYKLKVAPCADQLALNRYLVSESAMASLCAVLLTVFLVNSVANEQDNISKYLVDHDVLDMLVTIVRCDGAPLPARVQCYQLCQLLACTPEGKTQMPVEEMAHLLVFLMQTKYVSLQEISTRGCAILAGETNIHRTRVILAEVGAIDVLMAHAKRPNTHIIREMAVKALLNLSTVADNQVAICKKGLYLLLRLNQDEEGDPDIKRCTSALLHNLSKNAANRTRLYKAELRTKSGSVQEAWAESGDWRHDQATWAQGEAARRSVYFSDGVGSEESEAQTPRPSTQMEGRYLEDREAKMHLQKDMCKPVASLWNKFTADTYGLDLGQLPNSTRWQPKVCGYRAEDWRSTGSGPKKSGAWEAETAKIAAPGGIRTARMVEADTDATYRPISDPHERHHGDEQGSHSNRTEYIPGGHREASTTRPSSARVGSLSDRPVSPTFRPVPSRHAGHSPSSPHATGPASAPEAGRMSYRPNSAQRQRPDQRPSANRPSSARHLSGRPLSAARSRMSERPSSARPASPGGGRLGSPGEGPAAAGSRPPTGRPPTGATGSAPYDESSSHTAGRAMYEASKGPISEDLAPALKLARPQSAPHKRPTSASRAAAAVAGGGSPNLHGAQAGDYPTMKVFLEPHRRKHPVNFTSGGAMGAWTPPSHGGTSTATYDSMGSMSNEKKDRMYMFDAVEGSKYADGLFPVYLLPDGRTVHYYHEPRRLVDGVDVFWEEIAPPHHLRDIFQASLPSVGETLLDALATQQEDGAAVNLDHLRGLCERPPGPGKHTMNIVAHACTNCPGCKKHGHISAAPMKMCVQLIRHEDVPTTDISQYIPANRPQIYEQLSMPVGNSPLAVLTSAMTKEPWELDNSVFAPRKEEAECRDYWDSEKVTRDMFEIDWQLLTSEGPKGRFVSMITNRFRNLDMAELVKSMARQHYDLICRVYDYYCCLGSGGNHFSMQTNEWTMFLKEAEVLDNGMKSRTKRADCDQIFQLINQIIQVPKDGVSPDNRKAAPVVVAPPRGAMGRRKSAIAFELHALLRFEFIAAVIRLGIAKFLDEKTHVEKGNIPKALDLLCFFIRENIEKNRQEALISVNDFRTQRLYTEEVDALYKSEERLLHALYKHYKGANSFDLTKNMMKLDGWLALMEHSNVIGHESNVSIREVNLCFSWSRMDFSNEMSTKDTFGACFTYVDFLEGLGRLSDFISPPEPSMCEDYVLEHDVKYSSTENDEWVAQFGPTYRFYSLIRNNRALSDKTLEKGRRTSEGFLTENTRPLQDKIAQLLELLRGGLSKHHGAKNISDLLEILQRGAYLGRCAGAFEK
ncbi:hypothetical protein CYMTET_52532 [Cymbomonas tetramitiformis]|uniref:Uncharacterized protein n=1 Tax=Cymbomonas tetramitiformis TaxID=36881 RepID=A0AAE0BIV1_9CHLO|nr:hypothetical protein CYMTET_52532 [Cymbomonas tetramitiformis]